MAGIRNYGPSFTLLFVIVITLVGAPYALRRLAYAEQEARIELAAAKLQSSQRLAELSESFRLVAQRVEPSVVHISVSRKVSGRSSIRPPSNFDNPMDFFRWFEQRRRGQIDPRPDEQDESLRQYDVPQPYGNGSGWIYDDQGHIVTNYHVVRNAGEINVKFSDQKTLKAEVVGYDEKTDIAVLKVESSRLHPAVIAERPVEQGEMVFAFGSPFQFDFSMSQGIVSGKGRRLGILGQGGYENFIQTDAAINPGNSGGPLTNIHGEVIGMNTAIATRTGAYNGIGFAIPADMLTAFIPQIIERGQVRRGYLGVYISDEPRLLKSFGVEKGVLVEDVRPDTPAAEAGLKRGDVIVELDGREAESASSLRRYVARQVPGHKLEMQIVRDGKTIERTVVLAELPDDPLAGGAAPRSVDPEEADNATLTKLGFETVTEMTTARAKRLGVDPIEGVLVEKVRPGSIAAAEQIMPGMVIGDVQGVAVTTPAELSAALKKHDLSEGVRLTVKVFLDGRWASRFVVMQILE